MRHESVWPATADPTSYPALSGDLDVDVAVIGAGLTGLTTALLVRRGSGRTVAVLEADRVGSGTTGGTTGKVTSQHGLVYASMADRLGDDAARTYGEANQAGVELIARLAAEHAIDCDLTRAPAVVYTTDSGRSGEFEAEAEVAARLGLPARTTRETGLPLKAAAAVRFDDQLHLHPVRFLAGMARALYEAGGVIYEQTRVTKVDEQSDHSVELSTTRGTVRAAQVVVATLLPIGTLGGYFAKTRPTRSYGLAAILREPAPPGMTICADSPVRSTRPWPGPGPNGLIVVGNDHETGTEEQTADRYVDLADWTRRTFDVETIEYRWSAQDFTTPDHLPYVGRSPLTRSVFVATGFQKWGLSNGAAAAVMIDDLLADRDNAWLPVFDATRIGDARTVAGLIKDNLQVGKHLVAGQLSRFSTRPAAELAPGTGGPVRLDGHTVGGYRDPDGLLHTVSLTCTHLGCRLNWNEAETSWDCPCHGSRFSVDGAVLDGPAVEALKTERDANRDRP